MNTELKLNRNNYLSDINLLQLRPVPVIENFSKLAPLNKTHQILAKTPFVYGRFNYTAPILLTEDKNIARYGISIPEPVIVWDTSHQKGHRLFWGNKGDNCLALFNPEEGRTLSHDLSILPEFGKFRENFHAIGVPQLDSMSLFDKLKPVEFPLLDGDGMGRFRMTPFPVTIESDGRSGRISIPLEHWNIFNNNFNNS